MSGQVKFLIIVEHDGHGFSAHCPDLPGCVAAADTLDETLRLMREAIPFHLEGLREDNLDIPEPTTEADYCYVEMTA